MPYLMINGVKQEIETFGDIHNPPLILLNGGATSKESWHIWDWNNSIARLAEENYVICYDRRGHGQSRVPAGTTIKDMANDLFTLIDTLCIEKANVVGLSAGTYVLGCAAGIAPERFTSMTLIVPHSHTVGGSPATHVMRSMGINPATATPEQMKAVFKLNWGPMFSDEANFLKWQSQFNKYPELPAEDVAEAYKAISNFDNRDNFKKLKLPTLVMSGKYDKFCPQEIGREIAESIDGGQFVEFADSGHCLYFEENEKCINLMIEFLRSTR